MATLSSASPEVRALYDLLVAVPYGGTVTLEAMSEAVGRNISSCRYIIYDAMRILEKESGAIFTCLRNVGYERLPPEDAHRLGYAVRSRIRRSSRRAYQTIAAAIQTSNSISDESVRRAMAEISTLGLIEHLSREASVKSEQKNNPNVTSISVPETARRLLSAIGTLQ